MRSLFLQGFDIVKGKRLYSGRVETGAGGYIAVGPDDDHVGPHPGQLLLDALFGALSDGYHGYNGRHADDDTQHGQKCPQLVPLQGFQRDPEKIE
jgi:hypothetical protein